MGSVDFVAETLDCSLVPPCTCTGGGARNPALKSRIPPTSRVRRCPHPERRSKAPPALAGYIIGITITNRRSHDSQATKRLWDHVVPP